MKRLVILAVTIIMVLALAGCQKTGSSVPLQAVTSDQPEFAKLQDIAASESELLGACKFSQPDKMVGMKIYQLVYKDGDIIKEEEILKQSLVDNPTGYIAVAPDEDIDGAFEVQLISEEINEGHGAIHLEYEWFGEESITFLDPIGSYETIEKGTYYPIYGLLSGDAPKDEYDNAMDLIQHTKVANVVAVKFI